MAIRSKLLSAVFISSGFLKLAGPEFVRARFARWHYPDWFRIAIGVWEVEAGASLSSGNRNATLVINDNAGTNSESISLTGKML